MSILTKKKYLSNFGVNPGEKVCDNEKTKIEKALELAWKNRDFEIDKFWSRTAYFWAFIVLCFTGYGALKYGIKDPSHIDLLAISALGVISSFIWRLSIIASKRWQENWERHIDCLEDYVTGPIYKTLLYKNNSPSVSKLNLSLSFIIFIVWWIIFIIEIFGAFDVSIKSPCAVYVGSVIIIFLLIFALIAIYLYSTKRINFNGDKKEKFEKSRDINDYFD